MLVKRVAYYTVKCPRCKAICKAQASDVRFTDVNHIICGQCGHAIRITTDRGFILPSVRAAYKE
jgi:Zn finger protein HypA/HybF involved in hydrogenase expression